MMMMKTSTASAMKNRLSPEYMVQARSRTTRTATAAATSPATMMIWNGVTAVPSYRLLWRAVKPRR